ncbi:MAG: S26 family signal peptidase [Rhodospirillaceae bacterium]|nr:S26 family signal peptidase [Rhodospirillaceae bacterium]
MTPPRIVVRGRRTIFTGRRRGGGRAWAGLVLMGVLAALWLAAASRVHVNASWSDDAWGYLVLPIGEPAIGDTVLFEPPASVGARTPYLKTVRGLPGAVLTVDTRAEDADRTVRIDGAPVARAKSHALDGRPLVAVAPGVVPDGHYYLHADHPDSHDSRYAEIGPVPRERILGRAVALPELPWLGLEGPLVGPEDAGPAAEILVPETLVPGALVPETRR